MCVGEEYVLTGCGCRIVVKSLPPSSFPSKVKMAVGNIHSAKLIISGV